MSNKTVDNFETLLQRREDIDDIFKDNPEDPPGPLPRTRAEGSANLTDLMRMIATIITKATKKRNIVFEADEGARPIIDQATALDKPHIYYEILSRQPKKELKPMERQEIIGYDSKHQACYGIVWTQRQVCSVQFNIVATDYEAADRTMELFEELMLNYTSYFKRNGIAEIFFTNQVTDQNWNAYRQSMSVRNLRYYVEIEKVHIAFNGSVIDGIFTGGNIKKEE